MSRKRVQRSPAARILLWRSSLRVNFGEEQFALDDEGFRELAAAITSSIDQTDATVDLEPLQLIAPPGSGCRDRARGGGGSVGGRDRAAAELKEAIGLAGEVAVGRWLESWYGVAPEESWASGYRNKVIGDGRGDDGLGFDFRVVTAEDIIYFEVKSTTGADTEIRLGESQVRRAQSLAAGEDFRDHLRHQCARSRASPAVRAAESIRSPWARRLPDARSGHPIALCVACADWRVRIEQIAVKQMRRDQGPSLCRSRGQRPG